MASPEDEAPHRLAIEPIGFVRNELATKVEAARQPQAAEGQAARIELLPGRNFEHALEDLASWKRIWVIFWFPQRRMAPESATAAKRDGTQRRVCYAFATPAQSDRYVGCAARTR